MKGFKSQTGQAAVELVAVVPLIAVVLACGWQLVIAGHTWWQLTEAARLAARAQFVAEQRGGADGLDRGRKIAAVLLRCSPPASRRVSMTADGAVRVTARVPLVAPFKVALGPMRGPRLSATAGMAP